MRIILRQYNHSSDKQLNDKKVYLVEEEEEKNCVIYQKKMKFAPTFLSNCT